MSKEWKLVPVEPTDDMKEAGAPSCEYTGTVCAALCYEAMLAAAPVPPQGLAKPAAYISASVLDHLMAGGDAGWQWIGPAPYGSDQVGLFTRSDAGEVDRLNTVVEHQKNLIASLRAELRESHSITAAPAVERTQPISCDAANEENAPTFMGEPNPHHSIDWYREGIAKHWKTICDQRARLERLIAALKFYADREHYHFESGNWDTVSGEPLNILWCGDEPDFIEDGTVARAALSANVEPTNKECTQ